MGLPAIKYQSTESPLRIIHNGGQEKIKKSLFSKKPQLRVVEKSEKRILDYYAFGFENEDRSMSSDVDNTFGFNGKLRDKSFGITSNYDYGFRIYSSALGRFLSTDPLFKSYPYYTPYQFAGNTPIAAIDLDGLEQKLSYVQKQEYKPVFTPDAGSFSVRTSNAITNGLKLVNNTLANMTNFAVGTNNLTLDITAGHYNNANGAAILAEFGQVSASATDKTLDYLYNTPINEIGKDVGKSFVDGVTNLENWEAALELSLTRGLYKPKPKVTPLGRTASQSWTANQLGEAGESALRQTFGGSKPPGMTTPFGTRFIDNLVEGLEGTIAQEAKVGYKSATEFIRKQVAKDAYLLETGAVDEVRWIFYRSPATGKAGASKPLLNLLEESGIKTEIRELPSKVVESTARS